MTAATGPRALRITDLTCRDGHQSLLATRLRTADLTAIAPELDRAGFWSLEVWGGATFDVMTRFLNEDPWERLRLLRERMPGSRLQMLLRGQNLVGYRNYADDVVREFVHHAADTGIDVFRVFDALNDERNFVTAFKAIRETGRHIQGAISYSLTEPRLGGPIYNIEFFVEKAKTIEAMGADSLCLKDMAGLLSPSDAFDLVKALKESLRIPIHVHSHFTSGMAYLSMQRAIDAGVDGLDTCLAPFAHGTSHPAVEPIVAALSGTDRETGLDLEHLARLGDHFEQILPRYREFLDTTKFSGIDTGVLTHQIPGGMFSNMVAQLRQAGALDRLKEVYAELPRTRRELGYPPLVTPTSQIVGTQAVMNVLFGRYQMISKEVKDYCFGLYGQPRVPIDPEVQALALKGYERGERPITCRAADTLAPEMERAREETAGLARDAGDVLTYALYPVTGLRFLKWKYGLEEPPAGTKSQTPDATPRGGEQGTKEGTGAPVAAGVVAVPAPIGAPRAYRVKVGEDVFDVEVFPAARTSDGNLPSAQPAPAVEDSPLASASPSRRGPAGTQPAVTAPMPGVLLRYLVKVGDQVKRGDPLVVIEAMKMENTLTAPADGRIVALPFQPGQHARTNDELVVFG